jgi:hypothetical protein
MEHASRTDEAVEQAFREARRYEAQVSFWVQDHGYRAELEEFRIRSRGTEAEANKRGARPDRPDVWLPDLKRAIEVKGRNLWFKYCKDFPKESVFICSERALEKMQASGIPRIALVIVSKRTLHMLAIPWDPELWWPEPTTQRDGFTFPVMVAGLDQLRSMSWLLQVLRRQGQPNPGP